MENKKNHASAHQYAMKEGTGPSSYAQNSDFQRRALEAAQDALKKEIAEKLDVKKILSSSSSVTFSIADFGSASGPNAFLAAQSIIEAVKPKLESEGLNNNSCNVQYQVFFNDFACNDFNTLFQTLPPERPYFAAGVPGSFHGILFPKGSLNFAYSICALNWLSKVPQGVTYKASPAWNGGRIHYLSTNREALEAYSAQFGEDLGSFLRARSQEVANGGMVALILAGVRDSAVFSQTWTGLLFELLGSCFSDMVQTGLINKEALDNFNLPVYFPDLKDMKAAIKKHGREFSILKMEEFRHPRHHVSKAYMRESVSSMQAAFHGLFTKHFGTEVKDELFNQITKKFSEATLFLSPDVQLLSVIFVLLKRS